MTYETVGAWLDQKADAPHSFAKFPGLEDQIRSQLAAANRLRALRIKNGALSFEGEYVVEQPGLTPENEKERRVMCDKQEYLFACHTSPAARYYYCCSRFTGDDANAVSGVHSSSAVLRRAARSAQPAAFARPAARGTTRRSPCRDSRR